VKHAHRSAAAILTASLLGGVGAVAASELGASDATTAAMDEQPTVQRPDDAAAQEIIHALVDRTGKLDQALTAARNDLAREMHVLRHQRDRAKAVRASSTPGPGAASSSLPGTSTGPAAPPSAPPTHVSTGASGSTAPSTHTSTRASGGGTGSGEGDDREGDGDD
jgi:hypothetical protein